MLFLQHGIIIHLAGFIFLHKQFIVLHSAVSHPSLWNLKQINKRQRNNCSDLHSDESLSKLKSSQQNTCKVTWEYPSKVASSLLTIFYPTDRGCRPRLFKSSQMIFLTTGVIWYFNFLMLTGDFRDQNPHRCCKTPVLFTGF